jgi:hypothetical protein
VRRAKLRRHEFEAGTTRKSLRLDGSQNYDVTGLDAACRRAAR